MTACGIGYHILHDKMSPQQRARLLAHLAVTQPATVNVTGAEQYPASLDYVGRILDACPHTIVFERRVDRPAAFKHGRDVQDEGIWQIDVEAWYDWRVTPYLDVLRHPRVVVVYDNESNMGDFTPYADKMAAAAARAEADGVALGLGRFSTGTPGEQQYEQLEAMWEVLAPAKARHWWTPNEYMGPDAQSSAGHVARYQQANLKASAKVNIAIGEWAICAPRGRGLDPQQGFRALGWGEERALDYMIQMYRDWYQPNNVPVNAWLADNQDAIWRRFALGEAFYAALEARLGEVQISWPPKPFSGDSGPAVEWVATRAVLRNMGGDKTLFVREGPSTATARIGYLQAGTPLHYQWPPVEGDPVGDVGNAWVKVRVAGVQGYAHAHYLAVPESEAVLTDDGNEDAPVVIENPTPVSPPHSDGEGTNEAPVDDGPDEVCVVEEVEDEDEG